MASITNITARFSIGKKINLQKLHRKIDGSMLTDRGKSAFHRVKVTLTDPKCTALIYGNGKVILQGIRNECHIQIIANSMADIYNKDPPICGIVNMAGQGHIGFRVDLGAFHEEVKKSPFKYLVYVPDDWHGLRVKLAEGTAIVFQTGSVKLTGVKSASQFEMLLDKIKSIAQSIKS